MYEIRVESNFSAAHFLNNYNGKCENLHGHNYKVFAYVRGAKLDAGGMLMDFSKLKSVLHIICKKLDHTNLNDIAIFEQDPSAERIAFYIYNEIIRLFKESNCDLSFYGNTNTKKPYLYAVDIFETDTSRARYIAYL